MLIPEIVLGDNKVIHFYYFRNISSLVWMLIYLYLIKCNNAKLLSYRFYVLIKILQTIEVAPPLATDVHLIPE